MRFLLVADSLNSRYYSFVKSALSRHTVIIPRASYNVINLYIASAKKHRIDAILLSNPVMLGKLVKEETGKESRSLDDWAGAVFHRDGVKIIVVRPFKQLVTTTTGGFLLNWYVRKVYDPRFIELPEMNWVIVNENNAAQLYEKFKQALYIAVDIETFRKPIDYNKYKHLKAQGKPVDGLAAYMPLQTSSGKNSKNKGWCIPQMSMNGYCGLFKNEDGSLECLSIVLHINTMEDIRWMRKFNALPAPKITQNGGYEASYFIRYNAPLYNWVCDTFHFMHSWYAELPRTLDFIASMFLKNYQYWKDEIGGNTELYNAKDTYTTLWSWVMMVNLSPEWARTNYQIEFRKCFPAITSGLEGFKVDEQEREELRAQYTEKRDKALESLQKILYPTFNPNSPPQVLAVMNAFSLVKYKSSDTKALTKFGESGVFESRLVELISTVRECSKKLSTYINATDFCGRLLYELNHGGTKTGRAASKASNFWVGTQIQNQDNKLRSMYVADEGWLIANCDGSQAESRTTAYISGDENLIDTVENAKDFHTRNASLFFGIPEDEIVKIIYETITTEDGSEIERPKTDAHGNVVKDKSIRDLSKRVNHGSNYNMGAYTLLQTMGTKNVLKAQELLGLPAKMSLMDVCAYLLSTFEATYPKVKQDYYDAVIHEIKTTGLLTLPNGWTRKCFGRPSRQKRDKLLLNEYVAHKPQSLSVMLVDEAEFDFWMEYQIKRGWIRLKAQVHDEIVYMIKGTMDEDGTVHSEHYEECRTALSELMARPIEVNGRTLVIPNDGGSIGYRWGDLKD